MKNHKHIALLASLAGMLAAAPAEHALAAQSEASASFNFASGVPAYDQAYQKARGVIAADVKDGKLDIGVVMTVTMSADHRVVDGGTGAKFLQTLKSFIEEPASMLL